MTIKLTLRNLFYNLFYTEVQEQENVVEKEYEAIRFKLEAARRYNDLWEAFDLIEYFKIMCAYDKEGRRMYYSLKALFNSKRSEIQKEYPEN